MKAPCVVQLAILCLLLCDHLTAQTNPTERATNSDGPVSTIWSFDLTAAGYVVPQDRSYGMATIAAERQWLHLEGRYNYEDQQTGSLWVGYNFEVGDKLRLNVTPMIGGVIGNTTGVAPGYEVSLGYKRVELSIDGEFVFDTKKSSRNFFYSWTELSYAPLNWVRCGLVAQRTKAYETDLDIQRGFLVGISHKKLDFDTYILNAGWTTPTLIFQVGVKF